MNIIVNLYDYCKELAENSQSLYRDNTNNRTALVLFMDANKWFGQDPVFEGNRLMVRITKELTDALTRWLRGFAHSEGEKIDFLLNEFSAFLQRTCQEIESFFRMECGKNWKSLSALQVTDYVLYICRDLSVELPDFSEGDLHHLFLSSSSFLSHRSLGLMKELCTRLHPDFTAAWDYRPAIPEEALRDNSAYTAEECMKLCWFLFNEQSIYKYHLEEKARSNSRAASCLMFMYAHFFCALRATDLCRLPYPAGDLPVREEALTVLEAEDREEQAAALADRWAMQIRMLNMKPNKTRRFQGIPPIQIFIPDLLKVPVGIMLACSMLHYSEDRALMSGPVLHSDLKKLFGSEMTDLLGGHAFSTRKANKSYLQGIAQAGGGDEGAVLGYHLASLARCHKGDLRKLAIVTDAYLRDQNFSGVLPELALLHAFQRGPFSWIIVVLLEKYDKASFRRLSLQGQTEMLDLFRLEPLQAENLARVCTDAMERISPLVSLALCGPGEICDRLEGCFGQIETWVSESRPKGSACLLLSVGLPCKSSGSCMECPFEFFTKVFAHCLMKEYVRLWRKIRNTQDESEEKRLLGILQEGIVPVIKEMDTVYTTRYPHADPEAIRAIIRKGAMQTKNDSEN